MSMTQWYRWLTSIVSAYTHQQMRRHVLEDFIVRKALAAFASAAVLLCVGVFDSAPADAQGLRAYRGLGGPRGGVAVGAGYRGGAGVGFYRGPRGGVAVWGGYYYGGGYRTGYYGGRGYYGGGSRIGYYGWRGYYGGGYRTGYYG